ncbi:MAG: choice-of-anchor Q domain-containing protein, partial [Chloroflexota bacterium]|nr:choice-of-anchor Q domain-containing protein [Anaerolineales bacterium]
IDGSELSPQVIISGGNDAHIVISYSSVVTIFRVTITNCYGGAINSMGDLTLINTTLRDNVSSSAGGALISEGPLTILDSTIYHNQAGGGGGLMVEGTSEVNIVNSTITQNQASAGGAIYANGGAEIRIFNSTIAGNAGGELFVNGNVALRLYNTALVCTAGDDCYFFNGRSQPILVNSPLNIGTLAEYGLGELADNGGPTWTMALLPGSPLIDAGDDASCLTADQRRVSRPQGAHCDIGAYEYEEENLIPTTTTIITSPNPSISGTSVNIHVTVTGNDGIPTGSVTVTSGAGNCNIMLSNGQGSCAMAFSDPGTFTIAAHYNGDNQYLTSDGAALHTVMAAPPTSTYTPTYTPPPTATFTPSPTATFTVTPGPTPVAGCSSIRDGAGTIKFSLKTMYLDIPNPNPYPVTVSNVYVVWNYAAGHAPGDSSMYLQKAQLGSTVFWTGNLNQPSASLPLSTAVAIPASGTARITFTFDKVYNRPMGNEQIQILFSTPGCEAYPVIVPAGSPVVTPLP